VRAERGQIYEVDESPRLDAFFGGV